MKHLTTIVLLIVAAITTLAQAPQGFSYQAVVRKANNALVTNVNISVTVSILQGSIDGDPVYTETHNTSTNHKGLFAITIGKKNPTAFSAIDWSTGVYFLKTETKYGTSTMQMLSVPYSKSATKVNVSGEYSKTDVDAKIANPSSQSAEIQSQIENGTLKGKFSVSATEQVQFSQGNLQYQASTGTWRFAEHQWNYVGDEWSGNVYVGEKKCNNKLTGKNYDGWIDLFGWATSGYNDKQPYMMSTMSSTIADYGPAWSDAQGANNDITGDNAQYDWGVHNAIENGGRKAGLWRCLTKDEWDYMLYTRTNASDKRGVACVNGVNGLILLPDDWKLPAGLTFNSGTSSSYGNQYYAQKNNYTLAEWSKMESAGAVLLPAAGCRSGSFVEYVGSVGYYWLSDADSANNVWFGCLNSHDVIASSRLRLYGQSVRVVRAAVK